MQQDGFVEAVDAMLGVLAAAVLQPAVLGNLAQYSASDTPFAHERHGAVMAVQQTGGFSHVPPQPRASAPTSCMPRAHSTTGHGASLLDPLLEPPEPADGEYEPDTLLPEL